MECNKSESRIHSILAALSALFQSKFTQKEEQTNIIEYNPCLFSQIRGSSFPDEVMANSLDPLNNIERMKSFKLGSGKSLSFFFFTEDNLLVIKTLKVSEKKIITDPTFLEPYV